MPEMRVVVPGLPPSQNGAYPTGDDGRRHLSKEGREWHQTVADACMGARLQAFADRTTRVWLRLEFHGMTYQRDVANGLKLTEDALAAALGWDDRYTEEITGVRVSLERRVPRVQETRVVLRWQDEVSR